MANKVGRPKQNGAMSGDLLFRMAFLNEAFLRHRYNGENFDQAMIEAMNEWNARVELMGLKKNRISITTVKRTLAMTLPKNKETVMLVSKPTSNEFPTFPDSTFKPEMTLAMCFGDRPTFPLPSKRGL